MIGDTIFPVLGDPLVLVALSFSPEGLKAASALVFSVFNSSVRAYSRGFLIRDSHMAGAKQL